MNLGSAPGPLRLSLARARWEGLLRATWVPVTHGGLPICQALTAEIVKTIRDIIALNPLYRLVSCALPGQACDCSQGQAGLPLWPLGWQQFPKRVLVRNLVGGASRPVQVEPLPS